MDVCDVKATGEEVLSGNMMVKAKNTLSSGLSCGLRDLFSAFASGHRRSVALMKSVCGSIVWPARLRFSLSFRHQRSLHFFFLRDFTVARGHRDFLMHGPTLLTAFPDFLS